MILNLFFFKINHIIVTLKGNRRNCFRDVCLNTSDF